MTALELATAVTCTLTPHVTGEAVAAPILLTATEVWYRSGDNVRERAEWTLRGEDGVGEGEPFGAERMPAECTRGRRPVGVAVRRRSELEPVEVASATSTCVAEPAGGGGSENVPGRVASRKRQSPVASAKMIFTTCRRRPTNTNRAPLRGSHPIRSRAMQVILGNVICDFFAPAERLAVEVAHREPRATFVVDDASAAGPMRGPATAAATRAPRE